MAGADHLALGTRCEAPEGLLRGAPDGARSQPAYSDLAAFAALVALVALEALEALEAFTGSP